MDMLEAVNSSARADMARQAVPATWDPGTVSLEVEVYNSMQEWAAP
jgi:hypothetical protein